MNDGESAIFDDDRLNVGGGVNDNACNGAQIPYIVGPSCTGVNSCGGATIGSVDSSCNGYVSCYTAQLSGVDLINSCNKDYSCYLTKGNGEVTKLNDCCNDEAINQLGQCLYEEGLDIVAAGCVSNCLLYSLDLIAASLFVKYLTFFIHVA